jgi:hypothetical protein
MKQYKNNKNFTLFYFDLFVVDVVEREDALN